MAVRLPASVRLLQFVSHLFRNSSSVKRMWVPMNRAWDGVNLQADWGESGLHGRELYPHIHEYVHDP